MALLVLAYPQLAPPDFDWIETIRAQHNPTDYAIVKPHITFIFETDRLEPSELESHIAPIAASSPTIDLIFRSVMIMPGIVTDETFLFLVPDEGLSAAVRLHDQLYSGPLAPDRRLDIPYVPHITLGRFADGPSCRTVADRLIVQPLAIGARIQWLDLVSYDGGELHSVQRIPLQGREDRGIPV